MTDLEKILYTLRESRKVIKQNTNINPSIEITLQQINNSIELVKNLALSGVRKQLIAYEKQLYSFEEWVLVEKQCIIDIDKYLSD